MDIATEFASVKPATIEAFSNYIKQIPNLNASILVQCAESLFVDPGLSLAASRAALSALIQGIDKLPTEELIDGTKEILSILHPRAVMFEEQIQQLRELLARGYQDCEDWQLAAQALAGIPVNSSYL